MTDRASRLAEADRLPTAWMPRPSLTIGVTGHRLARLGEDSLAGLHAAVAGVLETLEKVAGSLSDPPALRLVTALAEGADSVAADEGLARGWALDAVLPFARDDYAADFPDPAARAAHDARLAACGAVFELPGTRDPEGDGEAYERAGRVVLGQCDILLAIWDRGPVRGRGGAAQIVAEAVALGIPVIHLDPAGAAPPALLWDGLTAYDLGQQALETVPRGTLDALPALLGGLLDLPETSGDRAMLKRFERPQRRRRNLALAYPLLLSAVGVRRLRGSDFRAPDPSDASASVLRACAGVAGRTHGFGQRLRDILAPRFARADVAATHVAQVFRSGYVANFTLAALAVLLALIGLALPAGAKPVLIMLELVTIGTILFLTHIGNRAGWHRRWLDNRQLAERLRCLAIAAQIGELDLRVGAASEGNWVDWYVRATAREIGLPSARVDAGYLTCLRDGLLDLMDDQIAYLAGDAHRMHRLEHRLHRLGGILFALTALTCVALLLFKTTLDFGMAKGLYPIAGPLGVAGTIASAVLPAIGAAIYGIRMQGDFAGVAERAETLGSQLATLRAAIGEDAIDFDTLKRRTRRTADLLTADLANWRHAYHARPLTLPG